jgi:hypothetical protein
VDIAGGVSLFKWNYNTGNLTGAAYISRVGIKSVVWGNDSTSMCAYCGTQMSNGVCSNCGNKTPGVPLPLGTAVVTFYGPLRNVANSVFDLIEGDVIDVRYVSHGDRMIVANADGLFRLFAKRIVSRRVPTLCAIYPADDGMIEMYVEVECDVQLLRPEVEEV